MQQFGYVILFTYIVGIVIIVGYLGYQFVKLPKDKVWARTLPELDAKQPTAAKKVTTSKRRHKRGRP